MSLYWFCFSLCLSDEFLGIVLSNLAFPSLTFSYLLALIFVVMDSYDALEDRDNVTFSDRVFVGFGLVRPVILFHFIHFIYIQHPSEPAESTALISSGGSVHSLGTLTTKALSSLCEYLD